MGLDNSIIIILAFGLLNYLTIYKYKPFLGGLIFMFIGGMFILADNTMHDVIGFFGIIFGLILTIKGWKSITE